MLGGDMTPIMTGFSHSVLSELVHGTLDMTRDTYLTLLHDFSEEFHWEVHRYLMLKGRQ